MTTALVIETSSAYCSLALHVDGKDFVVHKLLQRQHNQFLLSLLDELFAQAQILPTQVEVIGFGCGPGSFTGVRIAAAATQAIGFTANAQIVRIPSDEFLLYSIPQPRQAQSQRWICSIRSRGQAYYVSQFEKQAGVWQERQPASLMELPSAWLDEPFITQGTGFVGEIPEWLASQVQQLDENLICNPESNAAALLPVVIERFHQGLAQTAAEALPTYLHGDSPWQKKGAKESVKTAG